MVVGCGCGCARALLLLCCEAMLCFLAFPLRLLTSLSLVHTSDRNKVQLELALARLMEMEEMQGHMEDLLRENKRLQDKLTEQDAMEALLDEMEDDALAKIHALQAQLTALRQENMRLNEHKGKSMWDKPPPPPDHLLLLPDKNKPSSGPGSHNKNKQQEGEEEEAAAARRSGTQDDPASLLPLTASSTDADPSSPVKLVARRRSLFSLVMSVAVGAVAWSADAPCLPLLAGLFAVVAVSMRSVSRSCAALRMGRPAADAVVLISLNWFLLGVLTSPMLPAVVAQAQAWFAAATPTPLSTLSALNSEEL